MKKNKKKNENEVTKTGTPTQKEIPNTSGDYCICAGEYGACARRVHCDFANGFLGIEKGPFYISN